jgi:hypothetical protein
MVSSSLWFLIASSFGSWIPILQRQATFGWAQVKHLLAFAYQGKDIVFRFIMEYSSLRDFGP